jgi:anti-sigma B factor antagonist
MLESPVTPTGLPRFRVDRRDLEAGFCILAVEGEVDLATAPVLRSALVELSERETRRIVIDLSEVTYMDSTGLGVLVGAQRRLPAGGMIVVAGAQPAVRDLFALTGLDRNFGLFSTAEEAVVELSAAASARPALSADAALVLGLAATAIPFADSCAAQAERWLRVLRLYGDAGRTLNALGLGEAPLAPIAPGGSGERAADPEAAVASVIEQALRVASERGASAVGTGDLLAGVMAFYGEELDRVLEAHGADRQELAASLNARGSERSDR